MCYIKPNSMECIIGVNKLNQVYHLIQMLVFDHTGHSVLHKHEESLAHCILHFSLTVLPLQHPQHGPHRLAHHAPLITAPATPAHTATAAPPAALASLMSRLSAHARVKGMMVLLWLLVLGSCEGMWCVGTVAARGVAEHPLWVGRKSTVVSGKHVRSSHPLRTSTFWFVNRQKNEQQDKIFRGWRKTITAKKKTIIINSMKLLYYPISVYSVFLNGKNQTTASQLWELLWKKKVKKHK